MISGMPAWYVWFLVARFYFAKMLRLVDTFSCKSFRKEKGICFGSKGGFPNTSIDVYNTAAMCHWAIAIAAMWQNQGHFHYQLPFTLTSVRLFPPMCFILNITLKHSYVVLLLNPVELINSSNYGSWCFVAIYAVLQILSPNLLKDKFCKWSKWIILAIDSSSNSIINLLSTIILPAGVIIPSIIEMSMTRPLPPHTHTHTQTHTHHIHFRHFGRWDISVSPYMKVYFLPPHDEIKPFPSLPLTNQPFGFLKLSPLGKALHSFFMPQGRTTTAAPLTHNYCYHCHCYCLNILLPPFPLCPNCSTPSWSASLRQSEAHQSSPEAVPPARYHKICDH